MNTNLWLSDSSLNINPNFPLGFNSNLYFINEVTVVNTGIQSNINTITLVVQPFVIQGGNNTQNINFQAGDVPFYFNITETPAPPEPPAVSRRRVTMAMF